MTRHEIDRIIVGNQVMIMRVLQSMANEYVKSALQVRVADIQTSWRSAFDEEVGFSSALGDPGATSPPRGRI